MYNVTTLAAIAINENNATYNGVLTLKCDSCPLLACSAMKMISKPNKMIIAQLNIPILIEGKKWQYQAIAHAYKKVEKANLKNISLTFYYKIYKIIS